MQVQTVKTFGVSLSNELQKLITHRSVCEIIAENCWLMTTYSEMQKQMYKSRS